MLLSLAAMVALAAQPTSQWLDEARGLVEQLRFGEAVGRLEVARKVPGLSAGELREVLELLAYCQLAEGNREQAEATYMALLGAEPSLELAPDSSSPKVLEAFGAAKAKLFPRDYVRLEELQAPAGRGKLRLADPWRQVRAVTLFVRSEGGAWRETALVAEDGAYSFALQVTAGGSVEWYAEARTEEGPVARVASLEKPRRVSAPRIEQQAGVVQKPGDGKRIAGFVTLGLGVLLGAVATGLELNGWNTRQAARDRARPPGDFADTARAADLDGARQQGWATGLFIGAGAAAATGVVLAW